MEALCTRLEGKGWVQEMSWRALTVDVSITATSRQSRFTLRG
jgi:hypothetical protein